jgi:uncharacterized membrane protein YbhN (UPF0104 family)
MEGISVIIGLAIIIFIILVLRAIGAWLFRINEIINEQRKTNAWLRDIYKKLEEE